MITHADVLSWAATYDGPKFHALICDPPYHMTNRTPDVKACKDCGRVLGGNDGKLEKCPRCNGKLIYQRSQGGSGFMGKKWDGGDIAFNPETWQALAEHLHPGAFIMAFASARGFHRMTCAIEDAGLIIHPAIFGWCYGSGFPKASRIDTQIDKSLNAEREIVGVKDSKTGIDKNTNWKCSSPRFYKETIPATNLAKSWAGHRYGLQALKPALEPIIVAQKPYTGKPIESITKTGAGALWIDGARIGTSDSTGRDNPCNYDNSSVMTSETSGLRRPFKSEGSPSGRWPANFYTDDEGAARLDEMSGDSCSVANMRGLQHSGRHGGLADIGGNIKEGTNSIRGHQDSGGASRFFYRVSKHLDEAEQVYYTAKASRSERDEGVNGNYAGRRLGQRRCLICGRRELNSELMRCNCINPQWEYVDNASRNSHPTVKPIDLCKWLATLLLPPKEYAPRRILIPFAGTGSEIIGALHAGWEEPYGIEREAEYVQICEGRIKAWKQVQMTLDLS